MGSDKLVILGDFRKNQAVSYDSCSEGSNIKNATVKCEKENWYFVDTPRIISKSISTGVYTGKARNIDIV